MFSFKMFALLLLGLVAVSGAAQEKIIAPADTTGLRTALVLVTETGVELSAYAPLADELQLAFQADSRSLWVVLRTALDGVETTLANLKASDNVDTVVFGSHAMEAGEAVQAYVKANPTMAVAQVQLAGFLQRIQRPDVVTCLAKSSVKPKCSKAHPLGYLEDGAHDCYGANTISYPVPTLSIGGELDGVVRVARFAEAHYTQNVIDSKSKNFPVVVVTGMNHAQLLTDNALPAKVAQRDLAAAISSADARAAVAKAVVSFVSSVVTIEESWSATVMDSMLADTKTLLAPLVEAFVVQEGNWFFTGHDDEHGSSGWAAAAQQKLVDPLPEGQAEKWTISNEFRLLSDEGKIPPYYRGKHRADIVITGADNSSYTASTVAQLRFVEISVTKSGAGLNGYDIIKEEKINVLTALKDDGSDFVSAIEIGTKMVSRQWLYNHTGYVSPTTLDGNTQCQFINQKAYEWALDNVTPAQRKRFEADGIKLVMELDKKPLIPAGPWWIWTYLKWKPTGNEMHLTSYYAFFKLDSNPYGAGNHYCKLLSPARAMEWIITDGLRK